MGKYHEDEYLMLSGIQHFVFCKRQWALIHIEQQWEENFRTVDGKIIHENAHDNSFKEKRGNIIITRGMAISSSSLGISGECDIVEFHKSGDGITLHGYPDKYQIVPIEYKRGHGKINDCDRMQLTAQAICLEEMLCCEIPIAYLYYAETKRRETVILDEPIREKTRDVINEMHELYMKKHTPKVKRTKACNACSLNNICLPALGKMQKASDYLFERFVEDL